MPHDAYLSVVAATNFKQRVRKMLEYHRADRMNYAVVGTPNRLEYDQGFFVKLGDGAADFKPIAHLYKTQVYQLAEHLDVPGSRARAAADDRHLLATPDAGGILFLRAYDKLDLCLYARNHAVPAPQVAAAIGLRVEDVDRIFRDIDQKRRTTRYLHLSPLLVEPVMPTEH